MGERSVFGVRLDEQIVLVEITGVKLVKSRSLRFTLDIRLYDPNAGQVLLNEIAHESEVSLDGSELCVYQTGHAKNKKT